MSYVIPRMSLEGLSAHHLVQMYAQQESFAVFSVHSATANSSHSSVMRIYIFGETL